jgi:hypothetical protein
LKRTDIFGKVRAGHIILKGAMISGVVRKDNGWWRPLSGGEVTGTLIFDTLEDEDM